MFCVSLAAANASRPLREPPSASAAQAQFGPRGRKVGGACVPPQLFMVAYGSQRGSGSVRDAAIVTPQRLEPPPAGKRPFRSASAPTVRLKGDSVILFPIPSPHLLFSEPLDNNC